MNKFWVCAEQTALQKTITVRTVHAISPEEAILSEFGVSVKPASPFKYDFCTQESTENGYRYWLLASGSDGATLRSGVSEASGIDIL